KLGCLMFGAWDLEILWCLVFGALIGIGAAAVDQWAGAPCAPWTFGLQQRGSMATPFKSQAQILPTHTPALFDSAVARAAELLRAGELVALPTETVYGLAANA